MESRFQFKAFDPEDSLRIELNQCLDDLLEVAPDGTRAMAKLEKEGECYCTSVELYTRYGPIIARTSRSTPFLAVEKAMSILRAKLARRSLPKLKRSPKQLMAIS